MDGLAKEYLLSYYTSSLNFHGDKPDALHWSLVGQRVRYRVLLEIVPDLNGKRVLDYGCGTGDLYAYIKSCGLRVDYTGMDINPELIELAGRKHTGAAFKVADVEEETLNETFDIVFVCGVFNNRVQGVEESMRNVISRLFDITGDALAVNALSSHCRHKDFDLNYTSPEDLSFFVGEHLTPYYVLRQDYLPGDFTLFLYKEPQKGTA